MNYTKFDVKNWVRREHFEFYRHRLPCGFSLTSKIDITTLKSHWMIQRISFIR